MSDYGPNLRAAKAEILLRHAQERIAELEMRVKAAFEISLKDQAEIERLRAALQEIAEAELSSGGQLRMMARKALKGGDDE